MKGMMSVRRAAVAVVPMDSVTGRPVWPGSVTVMTYDGGPKEKKKDGTVIFWDNGLEERVISLKSLYFLPEEVRINTREFRKKRLPLMHIWMKPGRDYPWPSGVQLEDRDAKPGEMIRIPIEESLGAVRLKKDYPVDIQFQEEILLEVDSSLVLEGRCLMIRRKDRKSQEFFYIWEERSWSRGLYGLAEPLMEGYARSDGEILLVLELKADEQGRYQLPVMETNEESE